MEFGYSIPIGQITYELTDLTTTVDGNQILTSNLVLTDAQKQAFNFLNLWHQRMKQIKVFSAKGRGFKIFSSEQNFS